MVVILNNRSMEELKISIAQVQVIYQTKKQYIVANILKYRSDNLIILYYYIYFRLLNIRSYYSKLYGIDEECRIWFLD